MAESDASRREVMSSSLDAFKDHPLFGAGSDYLLIAHNSVVQVLAAGGVVLLLSLVPLLAAAVPDLDRRSLRGVSAASVAVVGWLVFGLFQNPLTDRSLPLIWRWPCFHGSFHRPRAGGDSLVGPWRVRRCEGSPRIGHGAGRRRVGVATLVGRSPADVQSAGALVRLPYCSAWPDRVSVELSAKGHGGRRRQCSSTGGGSGARLSIRLCPMPADFDGDGLADRSVWLPESGAWYVEGAETEYSASAVRQHPGAR